MLVQLAQFNGSIGHHTADRSPISLIYIGSSRLAGSCNEKKTSPTASSARSSSLFCLLAGLECALLRLVRRCTGGGRSPAALNLLTGPAFFTTSAPLRFSDDRDGCSDGFPCTAATVPVVAVPVTSLLDSCRTPSFMRGPEGMSPSSAERSRRRAGGANDRLRRDRPRRWRSLRFWASSRGRRGGSGGVDDDDEIMTTAVVVRGHGRRAGVADKQRSAYS